jgi:transposase
MGCPDAPGVPLRGVRGQAQVHWCPGGAGLHNLGADKAAGLLRGVRAGDAAAKTLRALAMDLLSEVGQLDHRIAKAAENIETAVTASGTTLTDLYGVGH